MTRPLLIVDDEAEIREPLAAYLKAEGFVAVTASDGATARTQLTAHDPALVILDWMLPDGHGTDILRGWRQEGRTVPVILLTAKADLVDKVVGLELGANDYVTKPFEPRELLARVKAHLRASAPAAAAPAPQSLAFGKVALDLRARTVALDGKTVEMTKLEYELLKLFVENVGRVFSRDELLNRVWGYESYPTTRTVDTHVLQLRQKLPGVAFETVRGIGYRLTKV